jgi:hypothetical protein
MSGRDLEREGANKNNYSSSYVPPPNSHVYDSETSWTSWLVPFFVVANLVVFVLAMYINNCPGKNLGFEGDCVLKILGRFSFQPLKENPLFGPSSST